MKSKTIYYETRCGLIPCKFLGWAKSPAHEVTGRYNAVIKLLRDGEGIAYKKDEVLHVPSWSVVHDAGVKDYLQMVRKAELPPVDEKQLIPTRW